MRDLSILHLGADAAEAEELLTELRLRGARARRDEVSDPSVVPALITERLRDHSAVVLFLTDAFAKALAGSDVDLRGQPATVLPLTYGVKVDLRGKIEPRIAGLVATQSRTIEGFSLEVLAELASSKRKITLQPVRTFEACWESPLYLYQKTEGYDTVREILVDVTWSAKPIQSEPADYVLGLFRGVIEHIGKGTYKILDFGAGKLRYSLFWLEKGMHVTAVDYPEPFQKPTPEIQAAMAKAEDYETFDRLVYPDQLVTLPEEKFDLAQLISVINIVPDPLERLFIIAQCHEKLKPGGYLIWFHYYGDIYQLQAATDAITDGGCTQQKGRKTFYKNLSKEETVRIAELIGFEAVPGPRFEVDKNVACLFRKARKPVGDVRSVAEARRDLIGRKVFPGGSDSDPVVADVLDAAKYMRLGDFLAHSLTSTVPGKQGAYTYEDLIHRTIDYVFRRHFKSSDIEDQYETAQGRQRVDIKANWKEKSALKTIVVDEYDLESSWVPIECKNYKGPLKNPEYAQLVDRCSRRWRRFGMIFCRAMMDREMVFDQCADRLKNHDYLIIVFDDADLKSMLELADYEEDEGIVRYVRERMEKVVDR